MELYSARITQILDDQGSAILTTDGASVTTDRIAVKVSNPDGGGTLQTRYYGLFAPAGTVFRKVGPKIKIQLGGGQGYLSLAALPSAANLSYFHQHAYAFVTGTRVSYVFDEASAQLTTTFTLTTQLKRTGFSDQTLTALFPHQWKNSGSPLTALSYPSVRGTLKVREGNTFFTANRFQGIVPQFTEPNNPEYSRALMSQYLLTLERETANVSPAADAYWQGKALHPLAMGVLAADEIGDIVYRDLFLSRLKPLLTEWYTYTPGEKDFFFYYNPDWGTTYYRVSEFGANTGITDHHFTYGYYVFASAVLASYDANFRTQYGAMVEHLIRDYANPTRTDPLYPFFRNFDPYEGHSWAGATRTTTTATTRRPRASRSSAGWVSTCGVSPPATRRSATRPSSASPRNSRRWSSTGSTMTGTTGCPSGRTRRWAGVRLVELLRHLLQWRSGAHLRHPLAAHLRVPDQLWLQPRQGGQPLQRLRQGQRRTGDLVAARRVAHPVVERSPGGAGQVERHPGAEERALQHVLVRPQHGQPRPAQRGHLGHGRRERDGVQEGHHLLGPGVEPHRHRAPGDVQERVRNHRNGHRARPLPGARESPAEQLTRRK
ncbi:glycosyl hydrolase [Cystobacter fuscus]